MRLFIAAALTTLAMPVQAVEVTHGYGGRFGVGYTSDGGQTRMQTLYEGRYSLGVAHRMDNGGTVRFELDIVAGNIPDSPRHLDRPFPATSPDRRRPGAD